VDEDDYEVKEEDKGRMGEADDGRWMKKEDKDRKGRWKRMKEEKKKEDGGG
jgi:hypothetical protein